MMHDGIARWIGENIDGLDYSTTEPANVFLDHMPSTPDRAVAVYADAGPEPDAKLPYDPVEWQIVVRSDADEQWAMQMWSAIFQKLHGLRNTVLPDGTLLIYALARQASPFPLGDDAQGRPQYSCDYRGEIHNPSEARPA